MVLRRTPGCWVEQLPSLKDFRLWLAEELNKELVPDWDLEPPLALELVLVLESAHETELPPLAPSTFLFLQSPARHCLVAAQMLHHRLGRRPTSSTRDVFQA
eukprot:COSAG02_NODE_4029_length_5885_cov_88.549430_2_plen_102_part_00